jgi:hypothetical protein
MEQCNNRKVLKVHAIAISWPRAATAMSAIVMTAIAKTAIAKTAIAKKAIAITAELQMACGKRWKMTHNATPSKWLRHSQLPSLTILCS